VSAEWRLSSFLSPFYCHRQNELACSDAVKRIPITAVSLQCL
jgi:hypothetical protein